MDDSSVVQELEVARIKPDDALSGKTTKRSAVELQESRKALKFIAIRELHKGFPFSYMRYEWPELIIRDPQELADFKTFCIRKEHLDLRIDDFQVDAYNAVFDQKHLQEFISGGTKLGKGLIVGGFIVNTWFDVYPDSKIILVGPDVDHVKDNLFAETLTWRRRMSSFQDHSIVVDCQKEKLVDPSFEKHFIIIDNPKTAEGFSGMHSPHSLIVFDEASVQADSRYTDALSQCASAMLIAISNPRQPSGWFFRGFPRDFEHGFKTVKSDAGPRRIISIGLIDNLNVRAKRVAGIIAPVDMEVEGEKIPEGEIIPPHLRNRTKPLIPGQGCLQSCTTLMRTAPPDEVEWRVYGRFPRDNAAFVLFQKAWRDEAVKKHQEIVKKILPRALGIDVAGSIAGDYCATAFGDVTGCSDIDLRRNPNLMLLKGEIYAMSRERGIDITSGMVPVGIDPLGLGQGLADAMELDGVFIIRVGANSGAERNKEQYGNRRAEIYGDLASAINPQNYIKSCWALPDNERLWEELFALEKIHMPNGRQWKLQSKRRLDRAATQRNQDGRDSVEVKIGRSPDTSDAVAILRQAIMELPDYFDQTETQFNPESELRRWEPRDYGMILVEFWGGKETEMKKEEFVAKYGENPKCFGSGF